MKSFPPGIAPDLEAWMENVRVALALTDYTSEWDGKRPFKLGVYYLWVDSTGDLRIKSGAPTSDTDGTIVGTQT